MPTYNSWQMRTSAQTTAPPHSLVWPRSDTYWLVVDKRQTPSIDDCATTHLKLTEATLLTDFLFFFSCSQTRDKTNPGLINTRSNTQKSRSKQSLKNSIQLSGIWPRLKVMILIKQQQHSWVQPVSAISCSFLMAPDARWIIHQCIRTTLKKREKMYCLRCLTSKIASDSMQVLFLWMSLDGWCVLITIFFICKVALQCTTYISVL